MMRDYLSDYLNDTPPAPLPMVEQSSGVNLEYAYPIRPSKPSKLLLETRKEGFDGFDGSLPYTYSRIYGGRRQRVPEAKERNHAARVRPESERLNGRAFAWLHRLGVRRLPMWGVCRAVSSSKAEADTLFAALALAEGLPEARAVEQLRRARPFDGKAAEIVSKVINTGAKANPELYAAYCRAHPFAWELGLNPNVDF